MWVRQGDRSSLACFSEHLEDCLTAEALSRGSEGDGLRVRCSQCGGCVQGAGGKLRLLKDKASDGVDKVRKKMGRNKDIQCRLHLKVMHT